jgi:hypothetical protein
VQVILSHYVLTNILTGNYFEKHVPGIIHLSLTVTLLRSGIDKVPNRSHVGRDSKVVPRVKGDHKPAEY